MKSVTFSRKIRGVIDSSDLFVTNSIDMKELKRHAREIGFDDVVFVAGDNEDELFLLYIQKINYEPTH